MAITKVLARGWTLEVNTGTEEEPEFTPIGGINTFTFSNSKNDADITDFDSEGYMEHIVASRSFEISMEGFYLEDLATGDRDAGQEKVEEYGNLVGEDSLRTYRLTTPGGTVKTFLASTNIGDQGGGNDDPTSWGATLTVSGQITTT